MLGAHGDQECDVAKEFMFATPVALPAQSGVTRAYASVQLADAFAIRLPASASSDPELLARFLFSQQPAWVGGLMLVRDAIVARLGLKTGRQLATPASAPRARRVGIFRIYSTSGDEIILGEDDKHLDFRVSVMCSAATAPHASRQLTVSTVVHCHNLLGRAYILVVAPIHRRVVGASLRRAARIGWPQAAAPARSDD